MPAQSSASTGAPVHLRSPADAIRLGIGMVHQHARLADNLTVVENVVIGAEPVRAGRLDLARAARDIAAIAVRAGLAIDPGARVERLSVGERQRVEILKVLYRGARILVLDEPTAVLAPARGARAGGRSARPCRRRLRGRVHQPQARRGARASPTGSR